MAIGRVGGLEGGGGGFAIFMKVNTIPGFHAASSHVVSQSQVIFPASAPHEGNCWGIKY